MMEWWKFRLPPHERALVWTIDIAVGAVVLPALGVAMLIGKLRREKCRRC